MIATSIFLNLATAMLAIVIVARGRGSRVKTIERRIAERAGRTMLEATE